MRRKRLAIYKDSPYELKNKYSVQEAFELYSETINKLLPRLKKISMSEFGQNANFRENLAFFSTPVPSISADEIYYRLSRAIGYEKSSLSSVQGLRKQRDRSIETMQKHNYLGITKRNFNDFANFMDIVKTAYQSTMYDSTRIVEIFEEADKSGTPPLELYKYYNKWRKTKPSGTKKKKFVSPRKKSRKEARLRKKARQAKTGRRKRK